MKLGSSTRRHGVIGCIGYENANPPLCVPCIETAEIGIGTSRHDDGGDHALGGGAPPEQHHDDGRQVGRGGDCEGQSHKERNVHPLEEYAQEDGDADRHRQGGAGHLPGTDSGGLQEEAPSLGKPVLVLRKVTERQEGVEAGTLKLAGMEAEDIVREASLLLDDRAAYDAMATRANPYGDGTASVKIVQKILADMGQST